MYIVDKFGYDYSPLSLMAISANLYLLTLSRRQGLMLSFFFQGFWMYLLAGFGQKSDQTPNEKNLVVAAFMLFSMFYNVSLMQRNGTMGMVESN